MALAFVVNIFAIMPSADSHETGEMASHYMVSTTIELTKSHENNGHNHVEKCGVASCAIGLPEHFTTTATTFGKKTLFDVWTAHVTSRHLTPRDRPPKV